MPEVPCGCKGNDKNCKRCGGTGKVWIDAGSGR
jgi:hypothetical protein